MSYSAYAVALSFFSSEYRSSRVPPISNITALIICSAPFSLFSYRKRLHCLNELYNALFVFVNIIEKKFPDFTEKSGPYRKHPRIFRKPLRCCGRSCPCRQDTMASAVQQRNRLRMLSGACLLGSCVLSAGMPLPRTAQPHPADLLCVFLQRKRHSITRCWGTPSFMTGCISPMISGRA